MLKALVFLSVIVSLVYSAPYGGGIADSGNLGISLGGGREIVIGLGEASREYATPVASANIGLGEVHHEIAAPLSSSTFMGSSSSVAGVGAPIVQRLESEPVVFHETRPIETSFIAHEAPQTLSFSALKSSGGY